MARSRFVHAIGSAVAGLLVALALVAPPASARSGFDVHAAPVPAPIGAPAAAAFHQYSIARESSLGHYIGGRADIRRIHYAGASCVYEPIWLRWSGGWIEFGVAHGCSKGHMWLYNYISCDGWNGFKKTQQVAADGSQHSMIIQRAGNGYDLLLDHRLWYHAQSRCLSPTYMDTGIESYDGGLSIPAHTANNLRYGDTAGNWHYWSGRDKSSVDSRMCGRWMNSSTWRGGENTSC